MVPVDTAVADEAALAVLEAGEITFLYRPRVEVVRPRGFRDVQRLLVLLSPRGRDLQRLICVGRKRMPDPAERGHARYWGFVARVGRARTLLEEELVPYTYTTKTRGLRHQPAARRAGTGLYRIERHDDHTHLSYELRAPREIGAVQEDLHVQPRASYVLSVKNPARPTPAYLERGEPADPALPPELGRRFRGRRYAPADPPSFLDHEGLELLLIAAGDEARDGPGPAAGHGTAAPAPAGSSGR